MIKLCGVTKRFGARTVADHLDLEIPSGKMTCIIGRSGEGKSVLLKQIIGLVKPDSGKIFIDDLEVTGLSGHELEKVFAQCGYVFQFAALLDSLNVFENIGITLLEKGTPADRVKAIVIEKLKQVNLQEDVLYRYPSELSGGMRKRVGLARTLIGNPSIILYDEPTTGLDPVTSRIVHELMLETQKRFSLTSIVISHDLEMFKFADYITLLHAGKIQYFGHASTIWESRNPYVYQFIRGLTEGPINHEIPR